MARGKRGEKVVVITGASSGIGRATALRLAKRGVSVVLVGPRSLLNGMRDLATRHGAEMVFTPPEPGPLGDALARAARRATA